ncbi:GHMP kinase, C-terminal domain [Dillenia turbinata]|uniref:phosphomevalonate kinase n=1 Tax=Dillenia turbinata TaxID=194707 RepID=A0AAN8ZUJ2_9MAGN
MAVVASAPGKVLLTGGYLILERPNAGVVLSTNARFYAIVKPIRDDVPDDSWAWAWTDVKLTSPQLSRETEYKMSLKHLTLQCVSSRQVTSSGESRNPFVEQALQYCIAAAYALLDPSKKEVLNKLLLQGMFTSIIRLGHDITWKNLMLPLHIHAGLDITILGSNDFYSYRNQIEARRLPLTPESLASLPPFTSITFNTDESSEGNCKPEVAKTGLGSSAAMTAAVVAALLHYLRVVNLSSTKDPHQKQEVGGDLDIVHIIAQSAHCIAQGKVGSGFDVSSAVYGSQRYVRFSPEVLSSAQVAANVITSGEVILDILKAKWDHERTEFSLPPLMTLLLGEPGSGGSSTVSMVGAVKKWQKSDPPHSQSVRRRLSEANTSLETHLKALSQLANDHWDSYKFIINSCSVHRSEKWMERAIEPGHETIVKELLGARDAMLEIRLNMRHMGEAAGVPLAGRRKDKGYNYKIEPESQTKLLDATMSIEGVLLAGVPGAGGFDAIFAVTLGDSSTQLAKAWSSLNVLALLVREDPHGVSPESGDPRTAEITSAISSVHIG